MDGESHGTPHIGHLRAGLGLTVVVQDLLPVPKVNAHLQRRNTVTCHRTRHTSATTRSCELSRDDHKPQVTIQVVIAEQPVPHIRSLEERNARGTPREPYSRPLDTSVAVLPIGSAAKLGSLKAKVTSGFRPFDKLKDHRLNELRDGKIPEPVEGCRKVEEFFARGAWHVSRKDRGSSSMEFPLEG